MKVIFLDIDGVLNSNATLDKIKNHTKKGTYLKSSELDEDSIEVLNDIIKSTNAKVVLHSSWRFTYEQHRLNIHQAFREMNLHVDDIVTTKVSDKEKAIKIYLKNHPQISGFVILDDYNFFPEFEDHLCLIESYNGLCKDHRESILRIINKPYELDF